MTPLKNNNHEIKPKICALYVASDVCVRAQCPLERDAVFAAAIACTAHHTIHIAEHNAQI